MSLARALKSHGRCAFVPFITAGDPSLDATARHLRELARAGADVIEVGVPFSDPVADGPTIQAADGRALKAGASLSKVLDLLGALRDGEFATPVVIFTYLNPVLKMGVEAFAKRCAKARVQGALIVDLPAEEAEDVGAALRKHGIEPVLLASPTTSEERLRLIGRRSGSIVYYVSREGVTGVRKDIAEGLAKRIAKVRALCGKPLIVGFGVSTAAQARAIAKLADGVVVGSALVAAAARGENLERAARRIVQGLK